MATNSTHTAKKCAHPRFRRGCPACETADLERQFATAKNLYDQAFARTDRLDQELRPLVNKASTSNEEKMDILALQEAYTQAATERDQLETRTRNIFEAVKEARTNEVSATKDAGPECYEQLAQEWYEDFEQRYVDMVGGGMTKCPERPIYRPQRDGLHGNTISMARELDNIRASKDHRLDNPIGLQLAINILRDTGISVDDMPGRAGEPALMSVGSVVDSLGTPLIKQCHDQDLTPVAAAPTLDMSKMKLEGSWADDAENSASESLDSPPPRVFPAPKYETEEEMRREQNRDYASSTMSKEDEDLFCKPNAYGTHMAHTVGFFAGHSDPLSWGYANQTKEQQTPAWSKGTRDWKGFTDWFQQEKLDAQAKNKRFLRDVLIKHRADRLDVTDKVTRGVAAWRTSGQPHKVADTHTSNPPSGPKSSYAADFDKQDIRLAMS
ncbi:hypothetical protein CKM354_000934900 [Cercospora kikuchii]|uniref:Uncharacterized protein n=1 Tax=Cercospora kikuchii TaxID=84275 RepID=A0A9P3FJZ0_9PEZI|nr:uncharacterized protein CKM354_000934900 [Cercospora kikuchii]GIZ46214.1 hypothetical protein CKM354_000934900 [Cercospora kikuchii]